MNSNSFLGSYVIGGKGFTAAAVNIASKAGQWIQSKLGRHQHIDKKQSDKDLVTEIDKGAENLIRRLIHTYFPEHEVLGEEGVKPGADASIQAARHVEDAEYVWIVDPIDGTTNFIHGFPFYSVSIALAYQGEVIVGVIYDPSNNELFVAEKGKGAYLRGKRILVSSETQLSASLVATGFPSDPITALPRNLEAMTRVAPKVRNIRVAGSAALHMAYVAAGRLSGFWEMGLNSWDLAAGALLVKEAGGRVTDQQGNDYHIGVRDILATNGAIHDDLQSAIRST